jgi:serine/threonine protein kinase
MSTEGPLSAGRGLAVIRDLAVAIAAAHSAGVAHRGLSPSVVHVDLGVEDLRGVVARVGGWDRAGPVDRRTGRTRLTTTGDGTGFVSPELLGGEEVNWQLVDLWCLGRLAGWIWERLVDDDAGTMPDRLAGLVDVLGSPDPDDRENASALELSEVASSSLEDLLEPVGVPVDPRPEVELTVGGRVGDRYAVLEVLGTGATGTVVAVDDLLARKRFAVKVFVEGLDHGVATNEFGQLLDVKHQNAVRVFDLFVVGDRICLKMELLSGRTLRAHLDEHGAVAQAELMGWADGLLDALEALHGPPDLPGILHRDLKPSNLIVDEVRGLVIIDFGLASAGENAVVGGSGRYRPALAPAEALDPTVDLFAVAVIVHEAMVGVHPFGDEPTCKGQPTIDGSITGHLREALARAMDPDRDRRFPAAAEFRAALRGPESVEDDPPDPEPAVPDPVPDPAPTSEPLPGSPLGPKITLEVLPGTEDRVEAQTMAGEADQPAVITSAVLRAGPDIRLDVEFCEADNGERWIRAVDAHSSPACVHRLVHGLRSGVLMVPDLDDPVFMELRQARIVDDPDWPRLRKVPFEDLDSGAGTDLTALLLRLGAEGVGTRGEVWGDTGRRKTFPCVQFDPGNLTVAFAAYGLTRLAPLVEGPDGSEPPPAADDPGSGPATDPGVPEPSGPPPETGGSLVWPSLDTRMSEGKGGLGDRYLPDNGYWVCHELQPWRIPRMPFSKVRTALFGKDGARAICAGEGRVWARTSKWGAVRLVVVRVGDVGLLTDGVEVALLPWDRVPPKDAEAAVRGFRNATERRPLDESAFE